MDGLKQAIPVSLKLTLDGVTYDVPPWDFEDFAKIEAKLAENKPTLKQKAEALSALDPSIQEKLFAKMLQDHERDSRVSHQEVFAYMTSDVEGAFYALWIAFDRKNPNVFTSTQFRNAIIKEANKNPDAVAKLMDDIQEASGVPQLPNPTEAGEGPPPMTPAQRRKQRTERNKQAKKAARK